MLGEQSDGGVGVKHIFVVVVIFHACLFAAAGAKAQDFDPRAATARLAKSLEEDSERERARRRAREDAEDAAKSLDFSQFGTPVEAPQPRLPGVTCITTGLGDGDAITTCR